MLAVRRTCSCGKLEIQHYFNMGLALTGAPAFSEPRKCMASEKQEIFTSLCCNTLCVTAAQKGKTSFSPFLEREEFDRWTVQGMRN